MKMLDDALWREWEFLSDYLNQALEKSSICLHGLRLETSTTRPLTDAA
jgi:hypothetical protein